MATDALHARSASNCSRVPHRPKLLRMIEPVSVLLLFAVIIGSFVIAARVQRHSTRSTFQMAFGCTLVGTLALITGLIGLRLDKNDWTFVRGTWTGAVMWPDVIGGGCMLLVAAYFWRNALRRLPSAR